jgi:probable F420-dependent oxidoreductase
MKFSLLMPGSMRQPMINHPFEARLTAADFRRIAATADELGFDAISVPEHLVVPRSMTPTMDPYHWHALTGMGFLAGTTRRCLVNSSVLVLPLHNPVELAKAIATLDVLTDGRVMCTFGAGYTEAEFTAVGAEFPRRGQVCDEYLEAMIELWESPDPTYDGEFVRFSDVVLEPRPRRRPTIWLGGDAPAVLRRAARYANGWYPWLTPPDRLPARLAYLMSQPAFEARPRAFDVHYSLSALLVSEDHGARYDNQDRVFDQLRSAEATIDAVGRLAELGVTWTFLPQPPLADLEAYLDHLRWQADEIMPSCR